MKTNCLLFVIALMAGVAPAFQPPGDGEIDRYRRDGTLEARTRFAKETGNHRVRPDVAARALHRLREMTSGKEDPYTPRAPLPNWQGMPTKGTNEMLVLLIEFPDHPHTVPKADIENKVFGVGIPAEYPTESLREYYRRSSYGQLDLTGSVLGWHTMAHHRSWYTEQYGDGNAANLKIVEEAIDHFDAEHDYSRYDNNGDGKIDYFAVIWTGPDTGWGGFWWGYQWSLYSQSLVRDGVRFFDFSWQWESRPVGTGFSPLVLIHETGHVLGLPDYYDYDPNIGPGGGVGGLDMMDGNMGDHNGFSKFMLEWLTPDVVSGGDFTKTMRAMARHPDGVCVMPGYSGATPYAEYFLVENRHRVDNDTELPSDGLLIWHVNAIPNGRGDDFLYNNSDTARKLLRLMEADGLEEIETGNGIADAGDYYNQGDEFTPLSMPNSVDYGGMHTYIHVTSISPNSASMTAHIKIDASSVPITLQRSPSSLNAIAYEGENADAQTLNVSIVSPQSKPYSISDDALWMSVAPSSGGSAGQQNAHTVSFDSTEMPMGTYQASILIAAPDAANSPLTVPVTLHVYGTNVPLAVNAPALAWRTGGQTPWHAQTAFAKDNTSAAQSGAIGNNSQSWLEVSLDGPGTLEFWWKSSCEQDYDFLRFSIDYVRQPGSLSGIQDWRRESVPIGPGPHTARWSYVKDYSLSVGSDAGWLDQVTWTPDRRDSDADGAMDWAEAIAGTDPDDPLSYPALVSVAPGAAADEAVLRWHSTSGRLYSVLHAHDPRADFLAAASNITATPPLNELTVPRSGDADFFRIGIAEAPPDNLVTLLDESFSGGTTPSGWQVAAYGSTSESWRFDDPASRSNRTGGDGGFAIADSDWVGDVEMFADLIGPAVDCSALQSVFVTFKTDFSAHSGWDWAGVYVDLSDDDWQLVWWRDGAHDPGPLTETVDLSAIAAGKSNVRMSFYYEAWYDWWWQVDDVRVYGFTAPDG